MKGDSLHQNGTFAAGLGKHDEAIAFFRDALRLGVTEKARLHNELACSLQNNGDIAGAIEQWKEAITAKPGFPAAQSNLGLALRKGGDNEGAKRHYQLALDADPKYERALFNMGNLLCDHGDFDGALEYYAKIVNELPASQIRSEVFNNVGVTLILAGRCEEAIAYCNESLCSIPGVADAQYNISQALLGLGRLREGWAQHEWRWHTRPPKSMPRSFPQPVWDGSRVPALLVHAEQGFGDCIQFSRFLPIVAGMIDHVHFLSPTELNGLFRESFKNVHNLSYTDAKPGEPLPKFSHQLPMLSLPRVLNTSLDNIPSTGRYLTADAYRSSEWKAKLREPNRAWDLKVGLCWAGDRDHKSDHRRSIPTSKISDLGNLPGIRWISVQKRDVGRPEGMDILDMTADVGDFADTAALIEQLSLVITVDTSIAHLAGSMGKPVWLMNKYDSHWCWSKAHGDEDNAWYGTVKVFRQARSGDWDDVIRRVKSELISFSSPKLGA